MMWWIYEFVFWAGLLLASPYYLLRMKRRGGYARGFMERFGCLSEAKFRRIKGKRPVWIHAVSVGEVDLALVLIQKILEWPSPPPLILSTTTSTGHAQAARKLPPNIPLIYYPLDSIFCFGNVHRRLSPQALILIEAELWPNHLRFCQGRNLPVALLNARLSERCQPRYKRFQWLFARAFHAFHLVTLQSHDDLQRLEQLGFPKPSLHVVGSLKYDTALGAETDRRARLMSDIAFLKDRPLWVAGSTHPGEEEIVLEIFTRLRKNHPKLALALAPRHVERSPEITSLLRERGESFILRSEINPQTPSADILLLNTTGELKYLYERATVIFMGKSLVGHGGQNIIEPAAFGKPVLFGPHMENFPTIAADFLKAGAAIQFANAAELEAHTNRLLKNPGEQSGLGKKALEVIRQNRGAMDRTVRELQRVLKCSSN